MDVISADFFPLSLARFDVSNRRLVVNLDRLPHPEFATTLSYVTTRKGGG